MSPLFTAIVVILALLAVMGIVVGVANDAVNFLNSALGSKVAPRRVILWVAAAGILVGTLTSSGMMEVARSTRATNASARPSFRAVWCARRW